MPGIEQILKGLNQEQKQAVTYNKGPLLVIAGAGTGKTTVITKRIAWLILFSRVKPEEILALTFTDKAAEEMEERVDKLLPFGYLDLWISTFHSFCERVLRAEAGEIGLAFDFKLLNQIEQCFLIRQNFDKFSLDYYRPLGNPNKFIRNLVSHFSRAKDELVAPEEYLTYAENLKLDKDTAQSNELFNQEVARLKEIAGAYHTYQRLLQENNALDFGDLIFYTIKLFRQRPAILAKYQRQFKHILVDEFQDTNWAQYELLKLLVKDDLNLTVVADPNQAIFRWRGASYSNIYQIKKDIPNIHLFFLKENYRSKQAILDLAYKFISQNQDELEELDPELRKLLAQKLIASRKGKPIIDFLPASTQEEEAKMVIEKILELKKKDSRLSWNDFAILVRANSQGEVFSRFLARTDIPHQFLAKAGLLTRPIIIDILSYIRLLDNYHESSAFYRLLISPIFEYELTNEDLINLNYLAKKKAWSLYEAAKNIRFIPNFSESGQKALQRFLSLIDKQTIESRKRTASQIIYGFLQATGYLAKLTKKANENPAVQEEIFWLSQFWKKVEEFERTNVDKSIYNFNRFIELGREIGDTGGIDLSEEMGPEAVKIMTVHSAKGLEFSYVFVVNLVERRFPTSQRKEAIVLPDELIKEIIPPGDVHLQEERRLFYVAMTRAKDGLFFTAAADYGGKRKRKISPFLYELGLAASLTKTQSTILSVSLPLFKKSGVQLPSSLAYRIPTKFSFSQFRAFETCPLQYKFNFILKVPRQGNWSLSFGKTIHRTFYEYLKEYKEAKEKKQANLFVKEERQREFPGLDRLEEIYRKCWLDEWYQDKQQKEEYKKLGEKILKNFYQDLITNKPQIEELEFPFTFKLNNYLISGKIDRIDKIKDGLELIDYKTGRPRKGVIDKEQLLLYQLAGKELFSEPIGRLTYYYPETKEKISFLAKRTELTRFQEKIINLIKEIKKGDFPAHPSRKCAFCDFKDICEHRLSQ